MTSSVSPEKNPWFGGWCGHSVVILKSYGVNSTKGRPKGTMILGRNKHSVDYNGVTHTTVPAGVQLQVRDCLTQLMEQNGMVWPVETRYLKSSELVGLYIFLFSQITQRLQFQSVSSWRNIVPQECKAQEQKTCFITFIMQAWAGSSLLLNQSLPKSTRSIAELGI